MSIYAVAFTYAESCGFTRREATRGVATVTPTCGWCRHPISPEIGNSFSGCCSAEHLSWLNEEDYLLMDAANEPSVPMIEYVVGLTPSELALAIRNIERRGAA